MSSLKMTFSLASLVLILGLVFATAPVMAQEDEGGYAYWCYYSATSISNSSSRRGRR